MPALLGLLALLALSRPATAQQQTPLRVTAAQFRSLRWLEGRWRGEAPGGPPFYESYVFLDDSTIATRTFADSAFRRVSDSSEVRLRGGEVVNQSGQRRWAATAIDSTRIRFTPVAHAHNMLTWRRESADAWTATLRWPARVGRRTRTMVYRMGRIGPAPGGR
jgi:hypothetical protein